MNRNRRVIPLTRRQFLVGASGFTFALPVLSSLFVKKAYGADPIFVRRPRLYWLTTNHGAAFESSFFPSHSPLETTQAVTSATTRATRVWRVLRSRCRASRARRSISSSVGRLRFTTT
jgi:hypothetical protein